MEPNNNMLEKINPNQPTGAIALIFCALATVAAISVKALSGGKPQTNPPSA